MVWRIVPVEPKEFSKDMKLEVDTLDELMRIAASVVNGTQVSHLAAMAYDGGVQRFDVPMLHFSVNPEDHLSAD